MDVEFPKININQNVIVLIIGLVSLAIAEMYKLPFLFGLGLIISAVMAPLVIYSMICYTSNYAKKKKSGDK